MRSIDPVAFMVFGVPVRWYGVMIALGVLFATVLACARERRFGLKKDTAANLILIALPCAIVCARLYYVAFSWDAYRDDLWKILQIRNGGLALYGGLIGGIAAGAAYAKGTGQSIRRVADLAAPSIAVGQAFGRWGNFFNQEAYGAAVARPELRIFPIATYIEAEGGWFYATFFYESAWCLLLAAALLWAERRRAFRRPGDEMLWYALGYAAERVAVESLRTDSLYWGTVRVSQLLSAALMLAVAICFALRMRRPVALGTALPALALCAVALTGWQAPLYALALLSLAQLACTALLYAAWKPGEKGRNFPMSQRKIV